MTWKGTVRSISAAAKRSQRESKRRQRELEQKRKQFEKMQEVERAAYEVQVYENYIDVLLSIHKDCGESWNWDGILNSSPPGEPEKTKNKERDAVTRYKSYKPSITDKLLNKVETRQKELLSDIKKARIEDENIFKKSYSDYKTAYTEWEANKQLAERILSGDIKSYDEAILEIGPFNEIEQIGSKIQYRAIDSQLMGVNFQVESENVIPDEIKTQLSSGKLSVKKMPKTKFYEIYQDYVCGCVLRIARELFGLLPLEMIVITANGKLLNTKTGYLEDQPILSVAIPRETLSGLNFNLLDPSDSMTNFVHKMKFMKTKGFQQVETLSRKDFVS